MLNIPLGDEVHRRDPGVNVRGGDEGHRQIGKYVCTHVKNEIQYTAADGRVWFLVSTD